MTESGAIDHIKAGKCHLMGGHGSAEFRSHKEMDIG